MEYKDYINSLKDQWVGKEVTYEGCTYNVIDVDYNGFLLIDRKTKCNDDTAVSIHQLDK